MAGGPFSFSLFDALLAFMLFFVVFQQSHAAIVIPSSLGPYQTALEILELIDPSRIDPFAPIPQPRRFVVSIFHPVPLHQSCSPALVAYMPPVTATYYDEALAELVNVTYDSTHLLNLSDSTFQSLKLEVCQPIAAPLLRGNRDDHHSHSLDEQTFPLLIFSPGGGASRLLYSAIAQSVASSGYTVITVDHPYDAGIVEFPDGTLIHGLNLTTQPQFDLITAVRASDVSFVIDKFASDSQDAQEAPFSRYPSLHSTNHEDGKVGVFGHSLGGTTAAATMMKDSRILAGINIDGWLKHLPFGNISQPLFLLANAFHNQSTDATWAEMWPNLHGVKMQYTLTTGMHTTFTDLPLLAKVTGFGKRLPEWLIDEMFGTIEGERALEVVWKWTTKYFDWLLKGERQPDGVGKAFPEVVFENGTDAFGSRKQ